MLRTFKTSLDASCPIRGHVQPPLTANCCLPDVYQKTNLFNLGALGCTTKCKFVVPSFALYLQIEMQIQTFEFILPAGYDVKSLCLQQFIFICLLTNNGLFLMLLNFCHLFEVPAVK